MSDGKKIKVQTEVNVLSRPESQPQSFGRRVTITLMAVVMLGGLSLRVIGLNWGVPATPYYRNYYQDERFALGLVFNMNPARFNFDPNYFINPSLHYYTMLGVLGAASALGLPLHLPTTGDSPFKPDNLSGSAYSTVFLICRWLVVIESMVSLLLLYLIGRDLYNQKVGLLAALLLAASYPCMYQAHFITADGPAMAWMILGLYFLVRLFRQPERRIWQIMAPVGIGLAIGAKYLNALLFVPYCYVLWSRHSSSIVHRLSFIVRGLLVAAVAFVLTTPYAVLSFDLFLRGDEHGFGGIFGARGLLFYNNFPSSLTEPFTVTSLAALNPLGLLLFAISLVVLILRRRPADIMLLCFIVPFYLMLMFKSSPMLRHILPVLPFVFLACAAAHSSFIVHRSSFIVHRLLTLLLGLTTLSWFFFSFLAVVRMSGKDTRVMAQEWAYREVSKQQTIALPTYFPYRYTPAIDSFQLLILDYDWHRLDTDKPDYLLMVEPEYRINGRSDDRAASKQEFVDAVERNPHYLPYKRFAVPFGLASVWSFTPHFPTEDWNYPSPEILIYKRR